MKVFLSLAVLALFLMACSDDSGPALTSSSESKKTVKQTEQVAYRVIGMKKAASGAT